MQRKLASIQIIQNIEPIPNADKIEVATVLGWKVVVKKAEFKIGNPCVYFEIDSLLPFASWSEFLRDKNNPQKPIRLKTAKMRGQISQGLALPITILPQELQNSFSVGMDVTEKLGVLKYEPPGQPGGNFRCGFPNHLLEKTDEMRIQSFPEILQEMEGLECYITTKIDGTSSTFLYFNGDFHVCSRSQSLLESQENIYWKMTKKYSILERLKQAGNYAIQAEIAGPSIQGNNFGLKEIEMFVFNVVNLDNRTYLDYKDFLQFCKKWEFPVVPLDRVATFHFTMEQLLETAKGKYPSGKNREGIVIRPTTERFSKVLQGRLSFKVINNDYLLKEEL